MYDENMLHFRQIVTCQSSKKRCCSWECSDTLSSARVSGTQGEIIRLVAYQPAIWLLECVRTVLMGKFDTHRYRTTFYRQTDATKMGARVLPLAESTLWRILRASSRISFLHKSPQPQRRREQHRLQISGMDLAKASKESLSRYQIHATFADDKWHGWYSRAIT